MVFMMKGFPHTGIVDETDGKPIVLNATELTGDAFVELEDDTGEYSSHRAKFIY